MSIIKFFIAGVIAVALLVVAIKLLVFLLVMVGLIMKLVWIAVILGLFVLIGWAIFKVLFPNRAEQL